MKRVIICLFILIGLMTFVSTTVEAKKIEQSEVYSYAGGSGSGSGSGGRSESGGGGGGCGGFLTEDAVEIIKEILGYFRILAPAILLVMIGVDFAGAVIAQDDSALKKAGSKVVARVIGMALLFFVPTIVRFILGLPGVQEAIIISDDPLCNTMNSYPTEEVLR